MSNTCIKYPFGDNCLFCVIDDVIRTGHLAWLVGWLCKTDQISLAYRMYIGLLMCGQYANDIHVHVLDINVCCTIQLIDFY